MKRFFIFLLILLSIIGVVALSFDLWRGKTMSIEEVKKKWGQEKFDAKKFKDADTKANFLGDLSK